MGVGPVLNLFVSLCVNRSPVLHFKAVSQTRWWLSFFGRVSKFLQTLQPFLILIGGKKTPTLKESCLLWRYWHWSVETGVGDLSCLGWAVWQSFGGEKGFNFFSSVLALVLLQCHGCSCPQTSGEVSALLTVNLWLELAPVSKSDPVSPRALHHDFEDVECPFSSASVCFNICKYHLPSPNHSNTCSNILDKSFYGSLSAMISSLASWWMINGALICICTHNKIYKALLCVYTCVNARRWLIG